MSLGYQNQQQQTNLASQNGHDTPAPPFQVNHFKRTADDDVQFISSNPAKRSRPVMELPSILSQLSSHIPGPTTTASDLHTQDVTNNVSGLHTDRCYSMGGVGLRLTAPVPDMSLENRGASMPAFENWSFPSASSQISTPRSARFSVAVSPKTVPRTVSPTIQSITTEPRAPSSFPAQHSLQTTMGLDQIPCLDFGENVSGFGSDVEKMLSADSGVPASGFMNTLGSQVPLPLGLVEPLRSQNNIPFAMYSTGNFVTIPQVHNPYAPHPFGRPGDRLVPGATPALSGMAERRSVGTRKPQHPHPALLPSAAAHGPDGFTMASVTEDADQERQPIPFLPSFPSMTSKHACVECARAQKQSLFKQIRHNHGSRTVRDSPHHTGLYHGPHGQPTAAHAQQPALHTHQHQAPKAIAHFTNPRFQTSNPQPCAKPDKRSERRGTPGPTGGLLLPSKATVTSASNLDAHKPPRTPLQAQQQKQQHTPEQQKPKKHAQNIYVDIAETVEETFPYAEVASRHGCTPAKIAEVLSGVILLPLLRCPTDRRRAGKLAHERMKEYKVAKQATQPHQGKQETLVGQEGKGITSYRDKAGKVVSMGVPNPYEVLRYV